MNVLMPQLGETVTEGTVANWHKKVGDTVATDEIILDIETDKVSMEIPSPGSGFITQVLVDFDWPYVRERNADEFGLASRIAAVHMGVPEKAGP